MATLGMEEEYLLLDPKSGLPAWVSEEVSAFLEGTERVANEDVQRELLNCQLETATPVCETIQEAKAALMNFRRELSGAAIKAGARAASTATAPRMEPGHPELTDKQRYHELKQNAQEIVADQYINGLHVHVSIPDRESGVQALNRMRRWLPAIIALSANSPLWLDRDSGYASWRTINYRRWPIQGIPPEIHSAADYDHRVQRMIDIGAIIDVGVVTWMARLSEKYPTLEVRAADAQLTADDSTLLAAIIRGLVVTCVNDAQADKPYETPDAELLDAAVWQAARHGMTDQLVRVKTGKLEPAAVVVKALTDHIGPALQEAGDLQFVQNGLERLAEIGTGAERQRAAMDRGGLPALLDLYTNSLTAE